MKRKILFWGTVAVVAAIFYTASCGKKHGQSAPVITVNSPQLNDSIVVSDTVNISITATDDESLHEMSVIIKTPAGDTVFAEYPYVHALKTFAFTGYFHANSIGIYHLHVSAIDHDNERTNKEISFYIVP